MMEVRLAETHPHTRSQTTDATRNGPDPSETTNIQQTRPTGGAKCAGMLCVRGCGGRAHATCTCAPTGAAMPLPCAAAMPRRKSSTSSGSGSGEDDSSGRRQKEDLGVLPADQLAEDDADGPSPAEPLQSASCWRSRTAAARRGCSPCDEGFGPITPVHKEGSCSQ